MVTPSHELDRDEALFEHTQRYYCGRAKIYLTHLRFEEQHVAGARTLDRENVKRLVEVFHKEGCHRLEPENYVPAIVSREILLTALEQCKVSYNDVLDSCRVPPLLEIDSPLELLCLHGRHRIEAAREYLDVLEQWWVVDFYSDGPCR